jgi:hypothetical protein
MDGMTIYLVCACVWVSAGLIRREGFGWVASSSRFVFFFFFHQLAYQNGIVPTVGNYIVLVMCATLGSMGAAPVPSSGIVMISKYSSHALLMMGSGSFSRLFCDSDRTNHRFETLFFIVSHCIQHHLRQ